MSASFKSKTPSSPSSSPTGAETSASSRPGEPARKKGSSIVRYSIEEIQSLKSDIDWDRINAMTEEEIEAAARSDPDWDGLLDIDWSKAEVVIPTRKVPISIRLDEDVLAFFKAGGEGYQRRINAVLRTYMQEVARLGTHKAGPAKTAK